MCSNEEKIAELVQRIQCRYTCTGLPVCTYGVCVSVIKLLQPPPPKEKQPTDLADELKIEFLSIYTPWTKHQQDTSCEESLKQLPFIPD